MADPVGVSSKAFTAYGARVQTRHRQGPDLRAKRLKPLIPMLLAARERHGHLALDAEVRERRETISAARIDRLLEPARKQAGSRRRTAPSSAIRRAVQIWAYADRSHPPPRLRGGWPRGP